MFRFPKRFCTPKVRLKSLTFGVFCYECLFLVRSKVSMFLMEMGRLGICYNGGNAWRYLPVSVYQVKQEQTCQTIWSKNTPVERTRLCTDYQKNSSISFSILSFFSYYRSDFPVCVFGAWLYQSIFSITDWFPIFRLLSQVCQTYPVFQVVQLALWIVTLLGSTSIRIKQKATPRSRLLGKMPSIRIYQSMMKWSS